MSWVFDMFYIPSEFPQMISPFLSYLKSFIQFSEASKELPVFVAFLELFGYFSTASANSWLLKHVLFSTGIYSRPFSISSLQTHTFICHRVFWNSKEFLNLSSNFVLCFLLPELCFEFLTGFVFQWNYFMYFSHSNPILSGFVRCSLISKDFPTSQVLIEFLRCFSASSGISCLLKYDFNSREISSSPLPNSNSIFSSFNQFSGTSNEFSIFWHF